MSFQLLLPSDDEPLAHRTDSLALWCQGFMHGLAGGNQGSRRPVFDTEVVRDIVDDFSEITRAAFAGDETETEGEAAYVELVEYVRVAAQLIYEEFHLLRAGPAKSGMH